MRSKFIILLCLPYLAHAQTLQPVFEAATVKPAPQSDTRGRWGMVFAAWMRWGPGTARPDQITFTNASLKSILTSAYGVQRYQISGPKWLEDIGFNIVAKVPPGASKDQVRLMLQNLLAERFNLAVHRETREVPVYALVVGKDGPKMTPAQHPEDGGGSFDKWKGNAREVATNQAMRGFAEFFLSPRMDRPVIDMTGLTATYDFTLYWAPEYPMVELYAKPLPGEAVEAPEPAPTIFAAVREQLGLKLEPRKMPMEIISIDRIEKIPTEN